MDNRPRDNSFTLPRRSAVWYVLDGHTPVPVDPQDPLQLTAVCELMADEEKRQVGYDEVGAARISTAFLVINLGFDAPVLFETRVFGGDHNDYSRRYSSWESAAQGHAEVVDALKIAAGGGPDDLR